MCAALSPPPICTLAVDDPVYESTQLEAIATRQYKTAVAVATAAINVAAATQAVMMPKPESSCRTSRQR